MHLHRKPKSKGTEIAYAEMCNKSLQYRITLTNIEKCYLKISNYVLDGLNCILTSLLMPPPYGAA
jgi:hypothetical protein